MLPAYPKVKGVHPGAVLKRELRNRNLKSIELAKAINEYPQTINAITTGRRGINPKLSIKLANYFKIESEYFMLLQAAFEIRQGLILQNKCLPSLEGKINTSIFWDTEFDKINWQKHQTFVIKRVLERGQQKDIEALVNFYGLPTIKKETLKIKDSFMGSYQINVEQYINQ